MVIESERVKQVESVCIEGLVLVRSKVILQVCNILHAILFLIARMPQECWNYQTLWDHRQVDVGRDVLNILDRQSKGAQQKRITSRSD